jgi:hypothetical protein
MSEQQLKDFGAYAETLVDIPDFTELDRRGHALRVRRRVSVAATLAAVLAVVGVTVTQVHRHDRATRPIERPDSRGAQTYVGGTMKTLPEGAYRLRPSTRESNLTAELTLPAGWNSWIGPNKFDGHAPGRSNEQALGHLTWYVGALVLEVDAVNTHGCGSPYNRLETTKDIVRALGHTFSTEVLRPAEAVHRFGYPATRMRLRVTKAFEKCDQANLSVFHSTADGYIQYAYSGTVMDVWVVDVDGTPIYVQRAWTPKTPSHVRRELDAVVDSIRFTPGT